MTQHLFRRLVIPVANKDDAAATARAVLPYVDGTVSTVIVVHVIEKADGALDKASVEQRELAADEMFDIVSTRFKEIDIQLRTEYLYGTNIGETIIDAAHEFNASAVVFTPRGGSWWEKLLTGDVARTLLNRSDIPVIVLPDESDSEP